MSFKLTFVVDQWESQIINSYGQLVVDKIQYIELTCPRDNTFTGLKEKLIASLHTVAGCMQVL